MDLILEDILDSIRQVPEVITGVQQADWALNHIFYGGGTTLGVGGQNRGRCPFVRYFPLIRDYDYRHQQPRGGTVTSSFRIEIVTLSNSVKSQEVNYKVAYNIWDSFIDALRLKNNFMIGNERLLEQRIAPCFFMLQGEFDTENTY